MLAAIDVWGLSMDAGWVQVIAGIALVLAAIGCWISNAFMLPGNWLIVGLAALFVWLMPAEDYGRGFGWITVSLLALIAAAGEAIEFAAGAAGAAKQGASRRAVLLSMVGAIVGSIAGAAVGIPVPIIGPLVAAVGGGAAGAFGGAYLGEIWKGKLHSDRTRVSSGALMGRLFGTVGKLAAGAVMVALLGVMTFMPEDLAEGKDVDQATPIQESAPETNIPRETSIPNDKDRPRETNAAGETDRANARSVAQ